MVKVNGEKLEIQGKSLIDYLSESKYDMKRIAVELNGDIVPKAEYPNIVFADGDTVEIVSFVGGG